MWRCWPKKFQVLKSFMEYLNDINNFYKSIEEQNPRKERKVLIMLAKMNAEMISDKILTSSNWTFYYR